MHGSTRVKRVAFGKRELAAAALLVDAPRAPAYELAEQAGGKLTHEPAGYRVAEPEIRDHIVAVGEVTGCAFDVDAMKRQVEEVLGTA